VENQHKYITGYRDLNKDEIREMNDIKELGNTVGNLINNIAIASSKLVEENVKDPDKFKHELQQSQRWINIARTHMQQGFMALTRAIARPESF